MKKFLELISEEMGKGFEAAGYEAQLGRVTVSNRPDLCEYQCNGAMAGAKKYHKAPIMIANDVAEKLADSAVFSEVSAVAPGFLNLKVKDSFVCEYLKEMAAAEKFGVEPPEKKKTIVVDYGGPNVAKPLHVGHLRSAVIGESIKRINRYKGHRVIGDVHLGDWGLQMGLIIEELRDRKPELPYFDENYTGEYPAEAPFTISELEEIYPAASGKSKVDDEVLDNLEEVLITSDVGVETTLNIIKRIEERVAKDKYVNTQELNKILREEIAALLTENNTVDSDDFTVPEGKKPYVIMVVGVNGVGKTTTIGKLAYQFKKAGKTVYLGAADTFRAAAVEQLDIWGERVGVPVIKQKMGSDPASVAFDTLSSAVANNADVVIIDTAGRLHNKVGLMNELTKIKNVMKKVVADAPHEVLLVLDGSTGQNAFEQAKQFTLATEVTAMAITKLDGTAKGGVVIGISEQFKIPVKYIGLGEGIEDMQVFRKKEFVDSLFGETE